MSKHLLLLISLLCLWFSTFAREGMWVPVLLHQNISEMNEMGFQLSADDVYSINQASLNDAIVLFGHGCTGELISPDGLLVTNHHCGFGQIQSHSSVEHDYLSDGFWAMSREQELLNPGLSVTFLVEMREVTDAVLEGCDTIGDEALKQDKIRENIAIITNEAVAGTHYEALVKPFYEGNQYYLFINERFTDVRLVGAPPSAIGKFGGDTDNWMWPRHTGDFSLFRIYAGSDNKPADYSPDNVPYRSKKFFPINIAGINEGDFTMVFGYPGTTHQYLYSEAVKQILEQRNPNRIAIRDEKLKIMGNAMEADRATRIQYAAKYASTSNAWKKWQGESKGLVRLNAVAVKIDEEKEFAEWVNQSLERKGKYGNVLGTFEKQYADLLPYQKAKDYFDEIVMRGTDSYKVYSRLAYLLRDNEKLDTVAEMEFLSLHFKDFDTNVDQNIFVSLFAKYYNETAARFVPNALLALINNKNLEKELAKCHEKSILNNNGELSRLIKNADLEKLNKNLSGDVLFNLFGSMVKVYYDSIFPRYQEINRQIDANQKRYMAALLEKEKGKMLFPNANLTMRVTYGKVEGYRPADGVNYKYYTTLDGIIEKDNPEIYDYSVPERLKKLYRDRDFGHYANSNGNIPVCFTASNHTTGGNSGSPVINAKGHLIGINFDRCWEGTMSDIMFDPDKCRNISIDTRYMLFLIDKFAGATYLLNEMEIVE
ncbi:MAG TPA: S46 family peptidase [Prolixibacteraceae bacterium]|nr:S46 family peptidase [Prolixibacteraceae bacterium]